MTKDFFKLNVVYRLILIMKTIGEPMSLSELSKVGDINYSHLHNAIRVMEEKGLVSISSKDGRSLGISLTEKGHLVAYYVGLLNKVMGGIL